MFSTLVSPWSAIPARLQGPAASLRVVGGSRVLLAAAVSGFGGAADVGGDEALGSADVERHAVGPEQDPGDDRVAGDLLDDGVGHRLP
ncbi:hypothetical protein [Klenkia soli]|uniref:hypothetical protein n=1 Tax=Klenkia soli TaxID=1052260 RepID=UPI001F604F39|nr:hypothetical protein [Klenkia soli]